MTWNLFTKLVIEHDHVPGTVLHAGDTAGNSHAPEADALALSFLRCARPCRASLLALWAPSCQALHKVPYIPVIRVPASGCCADERSWHVTCDSKHFSKNKAVTVNFRIIAVSNGHLIREAVGIVKPQDLRARWPASEALLWELGKLFNFCVSISSLVRLWGSNKLSQIKC